MTNWTPTFRENGGSLYVQLADQIEQAIETGDIAPGSKLPPQRNLAFDSGVTVGTVTRAYALLKERGLTSGEVGRGTYIRGTDENRTIQPKDEVTENKLVRLEYSDLTPTRYKLDSTSAAPWIAAPYQAKHMAQAAETYKETNADYVRQIKTDWQEAGAYWMMLGAKFQAQPDQILPIHSVQAGICAVIAAITQPGDRFACDILTYGPVPRSAQLIGRRVVGVSMDEHGIIPEALENVCAQQHPKALFLMPCLNNPTTIRMPAERRAAIADIARRHNMWIIEDNLYSTVEPDPIEPIVSIAPERTFHLTGLSKSVSAGLRTGWIHCPKGTLPRVQSALLQMTGGKSNVLLDASTAFIKSGDALIVRDLVCAETAARNKIVAEILNGYDFATTPHCPFIWLKLPEPWLSGTFKNAALELNVEIDDEDEFRAGRGESRIHAVRMTTSVPRDRETVREAFLIIRSLLEAGPSAYHSYN